MLLVNEAVDGDALTYDYEVYADPNGSQLVRSITGAGPGWQVDAGLDDNTFYWRRFQARDDEGEPSAWSSLFVFFVNTVNDAPSAPSINRPQYGREVETRLPVLEVNNAADVDRDSLTYWFEIDKKNTFDSLALRQSDEIQEGAGHTTAWQQPELSDNTTYYWRTRAFDGAAYGDWSAGSFFVNQSNDHPNPPTLQNPDEGALLTVSPPVLSVYPPIEPDLDEVTYDFEVYSDAARSNLVSSAESEEASWQMDVDLVDHAPYYWWARAVDEHGLAGDWSLLASFSVNSQNARPTPPTLNNPFNRGFVTTLSPVLSVNNSVDPDDTQLTYEFELYADMSLTEPVASARLPEGNLITSWPLEIQLTDETTYYWRARAHDGKLPGSWMNTAIFMVDTEGPETRVVLACAQEVAAAEPSTQTVEVTRRGSPLEGVALEIPPGALQEDCTITIGMVENPPALPENTRAINRVLDFGPDGSVFDAPITVRIPYTSQDLTNSGVSDPALLEIWTFNPVTLAWEAIPVDRVEGWDLIYQVNHFSIFATGKSVPPLTAGVDDPGTGSPPAASTAAGSGGGGGGGACFVASAANPGSMGFGSGFLFLLLCSVLPVLLSRSRKILTK